MEQIVLQKLDEYFSQLSSISDVSPAQRFRLEGYLMALLDQQHIRADWLERIVRQRAQQLSLYIPQEEEPWRLPLVYPHAPVSPSS